MAPRFHGNAQTTAKPVVLGNERTDKQEDEDGDHHHKRGVPVEGDSLDDTRFEDFIPPGFC